VTARSLARLLAGALLLACLAVVGSSPSPALSRGVAADVHGDDATDSFIGTGGLILPGSVDTSTRHEVAGCEDCSWRLSSPCIESPSGHAFDGQSACTSVVRGCPAMQQLLRAWFRPAHLDWRQVGLVCLGPGGPVTVRQVGRLAHDRFVEGIPPPVPRFQPYAGVVTQLPVAFESGQSSPSLQRTYQLLGESVHVSGRARWRWDFGDGASLDTSDPGGRYPHVSVGHVYRTAGERTVVLRTRWTAEYTVDGLGPFAVPEEIEQMTRLRIDVGEGRALLTAA
jgi:hypothetical protein